MGSQQIAAPVRTDFLNGFQYGIATHPFQAIGGLIHTFPLGRSPVVRDQEAGDMDGVAHTGAGTDGPIVNCTVRAQP